jgi:tetratricopeptide (TPR) repeat protein
VIVTVALIHLQISIEDKKSCGKIAPIMSAKRLVFFVFLWVALGGRFAAAADQWLEVKSDHFTLITNGSEKDGRKTVDQFERMRWVFQKLFGTTTNVDPAAPIVVIGAKDERTFEGLEPATYLTRGSMKPIGLFMRETDRNFILVRLDAETGDQHPYSTVYHEYTHMMFSSSEDWMPLWLNEGTAEFFQNTYVRDKDVRVGQANWDAIAYLRDHTMVPLNVLLAVDHNSPYYHDEQKGSVFYAESWALMHYLMITDREKNLSRVSDYMNLVRNHENPVVAGEKVFGDLKQLDKELEQYVRLAQYMEFVLSTAAAPIGESQYKVRPVSQNEAAAWRADLMARVGRVDEAKAELDKVLKDEPENAQALAAMGLLAYRSKNLDEALKWYGEAVKNGSQDFIAYYNFAQFAMRPNSGHGHVEIESALRKAIELNPLFAPAYDRLAALYAMRHERLDEAHLLNLQAIEYDPANVIFRVNTANVLAEMQQYDNALNVLKAAARIAKSSADQARVQGRIAELEQIQNARAGAAGAAGAEQGGQVATVVEVAGPAHQTVTTAAPSHGTEGVIREVKCSNPYVIEFRVEGAGGESVRVYNNNFTTIELSAAAGVTAADNMNPCKDFEGKKAHVQYVESPDKTVEGQVTAVELRK